MISERALESRSKSVYAMHKIQQHIRVFFSRVHKSMTNFKQYTRGNIFGPDYILFSYKFWTASWHFSVNTVGKSALAIGRPTS
jgi:hypothetical protein